MTHVTAALLSMGVVAPAWAGQVRLRAEAVATRDTVQLGDVADLQGFDLNASGRLTSLTLSRAPREGAEFFIPVSDLRNALRASGVNLAEIEWLGYSRCRVSRPAVVREPAGRPSARILPAKSRVWSTKMNQAGVAVPASTPAVTLETKLREYLAAHVEIAGATLEVRFSPASREDLCLDAATHRFEIRRRSDARLGLVSLEVDVTSEAGATRTVPVIAEAALVRDVFVARRTINRGELLTSGGLKLEPRRFTDLSAVGIADPAMLVGQKARRLIPAGEMITANFVEPSPIVRRGESVTIWMRQGGLLIKTGGRAQRDGALGDRIEVARDGSRRKQDLIEAVVTGPATVAVGDHAPLALATKE